YRHNLVVPDTEALAASAEVHMAIRNAEQAGANKDGFCRLHRMALECADAIVNSLSDTKAGAMIPAHIVASLAVLVVLRFREQPDEFLRLLKVEREASLNLNAFGDDAVHDVAENRSPDEARVGAPSVKVVLRQRELSSEAAQVLLLRLVKASILEKVVYCSFPSLDQGFLHPGYLHEAGPSEFAEPTFNGVEGALAESRIGGNGEHLRPALVVLRFTCRVLLAQEPGGLTTV